jgi:hypothetical protein
MVRQAEAPEDGLHAPGVGRAIEPPRIAIRGVGRTDDEGSHFPSVIASASSGQGATSRSKAPSSPARAALSATPVCMARNQQRASDTFFL